MPVIFVDAITPELIAKEAVLLKRAQKRVNEIFDPTKLENSCNNFHRQCNSFKCFCLEECKNNHFSIDPDFYFDNEFLKQNPHLDEIGKEIYRIVLKNKLKEVSKEK